MSTSHTDRIDIFLSRRCLKRIRSSCYPQDFKLSWVIFGNKGNRNTHNTIVIGGDVGKAIYIDCIVIVIVGIFFRRILSC